MYRLVLLAILLGFTINLNAQFKLSGKIINYSGKEELKINIPAVYGFYRQNSIVIPVTKDGKFSIALPIDETKFVNLIYERKFHSLLLIKEKNLALQIDERDSTMKLISGTAISENKVMQEVDIESYPFFLRNGDQYAKLNFEELKSKVVLPYYADRDRKIKTVESSSISRQYQALISLELKSIAYNYLNDLARTQLANKATIDSLILYIFRNSDPKPSIYPAGPQYYAFASNYIRYLQTEALNYAKQNNVPSNKALPYIGMSLDSIKRLEGKISKAQWLSGIAAKNLPMLVVEQYSYQQILSAYHYKEIGEVEELANVFKFRFPSSKRLPDIYAKILTLKTLLAANEKDSQIKVLANQKSISSIYEVIKPYKGKVIYLDIWGTWCGPCKEELPFNAPLKAKFKDKDVVFVYLDMDEDEKEASWKEFIKVNGLTGIHFRKNRAEIGTFWKELLAGADDKEQYYPQYFIFDKEGKLVVTKAQRPSSKEELYSQLSQYLE
jgi:thiol-disulfide isomerase/thioredoxin